MQLYAVTYNGITKRMRQQDLLAIRDNDDSNEEDDDADPMPSFDALLEAINAKFRISHPDLQITSMHYPIMATIIITNAILMENDDDAADMMEDDARHEIILRAKLCSTNSTTTSNINTSN